MKRNYNYIYKQIREVVLKRDKYCCKMPSCPYAKVKAGNKYYTKNQLQVHHITPWCLSPELRFNERNLITLCIKCHKRIKGHEMIYRTVFRTILDG